MNPPLFALLTLFLGPLLFLGLGRIGILLVLLGGLVGLLMGAPQALPALLLTAVASYALALCGAPGWHPARGMALWTGLCTLPLWATGLPGLWSLWPGLALTDVAWDPIARGWLYTTWGSGASLPSPGFWSILAVYLGIVLLLRCLLALCPILEPPGASIPSRDET